MFSQRDEEQYILKFFEGRVDGRLLDIGAYDGKTFSNTRQLLLNGWGGVLVEPSPTVLHSLVSLYGENEKVQIVTSGIGLERGTFTFHDSGGDAVSSFDDAHMELWRDKGAKNFSDMQIPVITWDDLFLSFGYDFEFLNLDAEGWSLDLLEVLPFEKFPNLRMVVVEFDHEEARVLNAMLPHGFNPLHKTAENLVMVK